MASEDIKQSSSGGTQKSAGHPLDKYSVQPKSEQKEDSPFYHSAAPTIALPKGGGALKGIDEKFSVNAINGTSSIQVALPLTPGRGGFTPGLSLSYSSGGGNGEFGLGWNLSLPAISRKTDKKLPEYNDANESDVFLLAGAEDLVPLLDTDGSTLPPVIVGHYKIKQYIPRIEGLFARIEFINNTTTTDSWWRVTTKDNITTYYGLTEGSRINDPAHPERVFKWLPEVVCDHKGNAQQYYYKDEDLVGVGGVHEVNRTNGLSLFTNKYLKKVGYCNHTPWFNQTSDIYAPVLPDTTTSWLMEAVLDYGDHSATNYTLTPNQPWLRRNDPFSDFHAGFDIRTYRKCKRVLMFHTFSELNSGVSTLVRSLELIYQNDGIGVDDLTETDCVTSIIQNGYGKDSFGAVVKKSLPPLQLTYQSVQWNTTLKNVSREDAANSPQGLTGPYQWIDLLGEGLPGILMEEGTGWFYKSNLGDGHFTPATKVSPKPSVKGLGGSTQWQDLDADGSRQLVSRDATLPGYFELDDNQNWQPFKSFPSNVNVDWNSPFTKLLDLDGDGRADLLMTEDRVWTWYRNEGKKGMVRGGQSQTYQNETDGPRLLLNDKIQRIFLADMNGDGMTDLVRIMNGEICYWPNKGYGKFGVKVTMSNAPHFDNPDDFNPMYLTLADISGTGAPDLIYLGNNRCTSWINLAGNGWSGAKEINPLPGMDPYSKIAVLDFLGNGTGCIVWSSPLPQHAHSPMRYIDLMGGTKPYLMLSYQNGMGKEVRVKYKSSTEYYLADKQIGNHWATKLPFPVQCVSEIVTTDEVSETIYSQSYNYHHGYYDHEEREFRGFGRVDSIDTDVAIYYEAPAIPGQNDLDQAPVLTKTWYHTGAWMRESTLMEKFKAEYCRFEGWDDITRIADFPSGMLPQEEREAHRALKGSALRQELYALDGSSKQHIPYTVTASAYCLKLVQGKFKNRFASFYNYQQQSIVFSCERNPEDPRIAHDITIEVDKYGNVLQKAQIVYPRRHIPTTLPSIVQAEQNKMHVTHSVNVFTIDKIDNNHYRLRLPATAKSFELTGATPTGSLWGVDELELMITAATEIDYLDTPTTGPEKRLLSSTRLIYLANDATTVLPLGTIEALGLPYQHYQLAFTEKFLNTASGNPFNNHVDGSKFSDGAYLDLITDNNFWVPSGIAVYSSPTTKFFTPEVFYDPWGNVTSVSYWSNYWLLQNSIADALSNVTQVTAYDWRLLQPIKIIDPNSNVSEIAFDALGMPAAMAIEGKVTTSGSVTTTEADNLDGLDVNDSATEALFWSNPQTYAATLLGNASWRCVYDLSVQPTAVAMIARERHYTDLASSPLQIRFTYTDGLGRVAMQKAQAADDPATSAVRWLGSGKTIYNNKGAVILQYEPYYSATWAYDSAIQAAQAATGVSPRLYHDPLGRVRRTELPDGTFSYTEWDNWSQTVYDANDALGSWLGVPGNSQFYSSSKWYDQRIISSSIEEQTAAKKAAIHADSPSVMYMDSLGRPFFTIQHNRYLDSSGVWTDQMISSHEVLDIQSNRLAVVDGRGITSLTYVYNLLKSPCFQHSIDGGDNYTLLDVAGQPLYHWDANGKEFRSGYDPLRRPQEQWGDGTLLGKFEYGEGLPGDIANNLRGQVVCSYDGAGKHYVDQYDFKGQPVISYMWLIDNGEVDADWNVDTDSILSTQEKYFSQVVTDALGRTRSGDSGRLFLSGGTATEHNITYNTYEKDGALKTVSVDITSYVQDIHHNAKGQREAIWYGNGTKTSYTYDPLSHHLTRLLTVNVNTGSSHYGEKLQDLNYQYDAVGNITSVRDDAQETIFFSGAIITPRNYYTYDGLYRLIVSKGRESINNPNFSNDNSSDAHAFVNSMAPWDGSNMALRHYTQKYSYDEVGNIVELQHIASGSGASYTRSYTYASTSNRLLSTTVGSSMFSYTHDTRGNMSAMPHIASMAYNLLNEMSYVSVGGIGTYYHYSGGNRVRKVLDNTGGGIYEERIYMGNYEVYRKTASGTGLVVERTTLHVADDMGRIAMIELRIQGSDSSAASLKRYIYSNHLQSASLELDQTGAIISYEEYHPFGTSAYQALNIAINALKKRYRFTGKERDEETGFNYHGVRYYIPWLCRWCAVDPIFNDWYNLMNGQSQRVNNNLTTIAASSYEYCYDNPINYTDPTGEQPPEKNKILQGGSLPETTIEGKIGFWAKAKSFVNGVAKAIVIAAAVTAVIAFTGGLGLAAVATALTYGVIVLGAAATVKTGIELVTGKDLLSGRKLGTLEKWSMGGEMVGGFIGVGRFGGKTKSVNVEPPPTPESPTFSEPTSSGATTFSEPTSTGAPKFSKPSDSGAPKFSKSQSTTEPLPIDKIRDLTEINVFRNLGYAEGEVNGAPIDNRLVRSGPPDKDIPALFDALSINSKQELNGPDSWLRQTDSEYKILNRLANALGAQKGGVYPEVTGEITLVSKREFCQSCEGVIEQFQQMFPNIKMNLVNGTKY